MTYKDILVHVDATARSTVRLKLAAELAVRHNAHLTGLFVTDLPSAALYMGDTSIFDIRLADEILARVREQAETTRDRLEQEFREVLRKNGIEGEWRSVEDEPGEALALHARYADLAIVGQADPDDLDAHDAEIPQTVMLSSGRPVLVVPYVGEIAGIGKKILVAWKSTREAARAVNDALPLLRTAQSVTVLSINPEEGVSGDGDVPGADIALHLARHGVKATANHSIVDGVSEGDILLNHASDMGADLIVAGGYGHSRTREYVLGGVSRTLLATMTVPVLFSH